MPHTAPKPVIFGCQGTNLLESEYDFFSRVQPLGFILFTRNCDNPDQVQQLVQDLRSCVSHKFVPILIDQEGGRVARLNNLHWRQYPPAGVIGQLAEEDLTLGCWAAEANAYLMGIEMLQLGINVNCAPLMDLLIPNAHQIIGDRAFHENPDVVAPLAASVIRGLQRAGVIPILKHLPGHGRALVDSHESLPIVTTDLSELQESDFLAFRQVCTVINEENLSQPWGMTAHIVYEAVDCHTPATLSESVIDKVIRKHINFKGFLITDCLTMKALGGTMGERAVKSLEAGCDAVLHCSGNMNEMLDIAAHLKPMSSLSLERLKTSKLSGHRLRSEDDEVLWSQLNYYLKPYWGGVTRQIM
ncbi:beta-N-acetylhexosaminidase [Candidatus Odyssella thessalonicensis]|uniref:beta-N-acetylhexosaminidase n=1 Tax=Candidatus Odyssella thessalonicensis TaxID=84647 RepID=UPI000225BAE8|nr:beta-N-acetylhexosaminidase [Candidatus Odyssella thessalonicensis]